MAKREIPSLSRRSEPNRARAKADLSRRSSDQSRAKADLSRRSSDQSRAKADLSRRSSDQSRAKADERRTAKSDEEKLIADNRKAFFDYHILESFEAGIALLGTEVKGIREGQANLRDSYAAVEGGEVWLHNVHINPYSHRGYVDHDPKRKRRLLLHKAEIRKLIGRTVEKGLTLVPTRLYFRNGKVKVALALARGKQAHDKRETMRRREVDRETRAAVKERVRR
jgi:SsrA-binding protein